jgi:hypothetical protein
MLNFAALRAPEGDGESLVDPPPLQWRRLVDGNRRLLDECRRPVLDCTLAELRRRARSSLDVEANVIVMSGHQPEPMHPGVWAKNIVVQRAASSLGGVAVNLVADTDHPKSLTLRVPSQLGNDFILHNAPIGSGLAEIPYETQPPTDGQTLGAAGAAIREQLRDAFDESPMEEIIDALIVESNSQSLACQWTAARRAVEKRFGVEIVDRFVSDLASQDSFRIFAADIMLDARRFAEAYNEAASEYRVRYKVRSASRPVPDLAIDADRVEIPFWYCEPGQARRPVYVLSALGESEIWDSTRRIGLLESNYLSRCEDASGAVRSATNGYLRPKALALTLYSRLFLADLFVHGIGGAKYDRVADLICEKFYRIEPPAMACVTATLRLPIPMRPVDPANLAALRHRRRDLRFNPDRYLTDGQRGDERVESMLKRRSALIDESLELRRNRRFSRIERRNVFRHIRACNGDISALLGDERTRTDASIDRILEDLEFNKLAGGREYFFGLYPEEKLRQLLDSLPRPEDFN